MNTTTKLDVFVVCQQMLEAVIHVGSNADQCVSTEYHARPAHAEVLLML